MNASRLNQCVLPAVLIAAVLIQFNAAQAQAPPLPPSAPPTTPAYATQTAATPNPALAAVIAVAQAKVKVGQFAEAVAVLKGATTPMLSSTDKKTLDSLLADVESLWGQRLVNMSRFEEALNQFNAALIIDMRYASRQRQQASDLLSIGSAWAASSQSDRAISYYGQALPIYHEVMDRSGEAKVLLSLGIANKNLSRYEKAIELFGQALLIYRQVYNWDGEAYALNDMGVAYNNLSQYETAISSLDQALPIFQQIKNRIGEAMVLGNLGNAYLSLSQYEKAIDFYGQALPIDRQVNNRSSEANALNNTGIAYRNLKQYEKAIDFYQQALPIYRQVRDRNGEAGALTNMGVAYSSLGQDEKAIGYYEQALPIFREVKDRDFEANALFDLGNVYRSLSQYEKGIGYLDQALPIFRQVKDRKNEAGVLSSLASAWSNKQNPNRNASLAILFGKEAVNVLQSIRADIHGLDKQTQKGFAKSKESDYRDLAGLLVAEGRLSEAEQVLDLLKEQEFFDFVRRDQAVLASLQRADLTYKEKIWADRYQQIADKVTTLGTRRQVLADTKPRTADQEVEYTKVKADLEVSSHAFQIFLTDLARSFATAPAEKNGHVLQVKQSQALQSDLGELGPGTVAIYALVGPESCRTIVVTPTTQTAGEYQIKEEDLNHLVFAFRQAIQDPDSDPRPLGKKLYDILIGPVAKDLDGAGATEVMWSLDGTLRYLPIAALSPDGVHYLIENPNRRHSEFSPASDARIKDATHPEKWNVLALGVSKPHGDFPGLQGVPSELSSIVRGGSGLAGGTAGIFPGTELLDEPFTLAAMESGLDDHPLVVHIASHFAFRPGNETDSFLLLGDGTHLTLDALRAKSGLFSGVELLTLSACETAMGSGGSAVGVNDIDGRPHTGQEVEGFGMLAQDLGAKAVLASLWPVTDASTPALMQQFYRLRQAHPELPKSEALRQAQVVLLTGGVKPMIEAIAIARRSELLNPSPSMAAANVPTFTPDPARPWAHPYYWAPFILIGNWK